MKTIIIRIGNLIPSFHITTFIITLILFFSVFGIPTACGQTIIDPVIQLSAPGSADQDDMCIWIHPNPAQSTIITADKDANKLFVYDLDGITIQEVSINGQPANIDIRYNFPLSGELVDIVAFCDRDQTLITIYKVNISTRMLEFVSSFDAGNWPAEIYGFCLYYSPNDGKFYAIASGQSSQMRQWELVDNGNGTISGIERRTWSNGNDETEGLVADDETGILYAANENEGIYKYPADPTVANPPPIVVALTGTNGLTADVEGITIYYAADGEGYLMVSSQGSNNFKVYERQEPHNFVTTFTVQNVVGTDGIDVANVSLNTTFPYGVFTCHNDQNSVKEVQVCDYADIGLDIDTSYWNPRNGGITGTGNSDEPSPEGFNLRQNYPNPFNPFTIVSYSLGKSGHVRLIIYDTRGRKAATLVDGFQPAGYYSKTWRGISDNGRILSSGIYLARIEAGAFVKTIKMVLTK